MLSNVGKIVRKEGQKDSIEYKTYDEVLKEASIIGSAINHEKLYHQPEGEKLKFIAIFSRNRPEWTIVDLACVLYGYDSHI